MWFRKKKKPEAVSDEERSVHVPKGMWIKCESCGQIMFSQTVYENDEVCPKCNYHFRIGARRRLESLLDKGRYEEFDAKIRPTDPLGFKDKKKYGDRIKQYQERTDERDAVVNAEGTLGGIPVVMACMEYAFMGGSMGSVVGEKITRAAERALEKRAPLIVVSCSGGARMQESVYSLMQMGKISAALARLHDAGVPFVSIMTDPTTGGVTASFAMLGDVNIAEPKALIGFAGPRVIEQTIRQKLPEGFQRSEFLLEKGMLDMVVHRREMRKTLIHLLSTFMKAEAPRVE
ncbi:MAG: acetyl-CoA carboxylase, carboxyltransferase subunit beta [Acidobacteriota bacterium]|jgi:acetyl-CoA carboxylase carboxyl transferase subunit beta